MEIRQPSSAVLPIPAITSPTSLRASSGPPMMPVMYNNNYQIVQTEDYVMILVEMVHDARIIRLNDEHQGDYGKWMGDSVGYWEETMAHHLVTRKVRHSVKLKELATVHHLASYWGHLLEI